MSKHTKIAIGILATAGAFCLGFTYGMGYMKRPMSRAFARDVKAPTQRVLDDLDETAKSKDWDSLSEKITLLRADFKDAYIDRPLDDRKIIEIGKHGEETGSANKNDDQNPAP